MTGIPVLTEENKARLDAASKFNLARQGPVPAWIDEAEKDLIKRGVPDEVAAEVAGAAREVIGSFYAKRWERDWAAQARDVAGRLERAAGQIRLLVSCW